MNLQMLRKEYVGKTVYLDKAKHIDSFINYDISSDRSKLTIRFQGEYGDILNTAEIILCDDVIIEMKPLHCAWQIFSSPRRVDYKRAYATVARYDEYCDLLAAITEP